MLVQILLAQGKSQLVLSPQYQRFSYTAFYPRGMATHVMLDKRGLVDAMYRPFYDQILDCKPENVEQEWPKGHLLHEAHLLHPDCVISTSLTLPSFTFRNRDSDRLLLQKKSKFCAPKVWQQTGKHKCILSWLDSINLDLDLRALAML